MQVIGFIVVMGIIIYLHVMNGWNQSRLNDLSEENSSLYKRLHDTQERESEAWNKYDKLYKKLEELRVCQKKIRDNTELLFGDFNDTDEEFCPYGRIKKPPIGTPPTTLQTARQAALGVHEETGELLRSDEKGE